MGCEPSKPLSELSGYRCHCSENVETDKKLVVDAEPLVLSHRQQPDDEESDADILMDLSASCMPPTADCEGDSTMANPQDAELPEDRSARSECSFTCRSDVESSAASESSCGSGRSNVSDRSSRSDSRKKHHKLKLVETMGHMPSAALQFCIDNPGQLEELYDMDNKVIGKGSFGKVRVGKLKATGAIRAVKTMSKERMKEQTSALKNEVEIMKILDHPGVVMLYEIFEDTTRLHLAMELCNGGDLTRRLNNSRHGILLEAEAVEVMRQILGSVHYLHSHHIVHRDLKSDNILLTVKQTEPLGRHCLRVSDFGLSRLVYKGEVLTSKAGTLTHMAPEMLEAKCAYDHAVDLWACGVILYHMLSGQYPFDDEKQIKRARYMMTAKPWLEVSQPACACLDRMLIKKTRFRYSARKALQDTWILGKESAKIQAQRAPPRRETLLQDMKRFRSENRFKRVVMSVAASMLSKTVTADSDAMFDFLDVDGDGTISAKDLKKSAEGVVFGTQDFGMNSNAEKSSTSLLRSADIKDALTDTDSGAKVTTAFKYTEFLAATADSRKCLAPKVLRAAFNCFDRNQDGFICLAEMSSGHLLGDLSLEALAKIIEENDQDGDNKINFKEFLDMMRSGCVATNTTNATNIISEPRGRSKHSVVSPVASER
ncbi:unnamed protein product [Polarella glacialis]|uniref:non-specific serine/threonine protein kinase n=1 Tax=Polarella glacialis TaxID=89957 RepID=A0A813HPA9_POLGL|nr:unnamed protein product [Polarella glacialis]